MKTSTLITLTAVVGGIYVLSRATAQQPLNGLGRSFMRKPAIAATVKMIKAGVKAHNASGGVEYQDENGKVITKEQYDALMARNAAAAVAPTTAPAPAPYVPPPAPYTPPASDPYASAKQYASSGVKASDYSEEGSNAMPLPVTSVSTPSAQFDPAPQYIQDEAPKTGVLPWLVGGGLLAAVAVAAA